MVTWLAIAGDFVRIACFRKGMGYSFETNLLGLLDLSFEKTSWGNKLQMQLPWNSSKLSWWHSLNAGRSNLTLLRRPFSIIPRSRSRLL